MSGGLLNHLWQSTLFALAAAALAGLLRGNRASVRHGIWLVASVKWLVPFAWLIGAGSALNVMSPIAVGGSAPTGAPALSAAVRQMAEPFPAIDVSATLPAASSISWIPIVLAALWACGALVVAVTRLRGWLQIRSAVRQSVRTHNALSDPLIDVRATFDLLEPGVVGIWRPVLLLPVGIEQQLTAAQLQSVLAHEQCHVRRRDNLTAFVHIAVETVFWFHPLVWWIGARLVEERERACDEAVLILGVQPRDYAEGIVNVCKHYVESPIACVAGVTGSNLKQRIEDIMMNRIGRTLSVTRKIMLTSAVALALAAPMVVGAMAPPVRAQSAPPGPAAANPQKPVVGDLESALKVIRDPAATAADKERLIGKTYSGIVVVDQVRLYPKGALVLAVTIETAAGGSKTIPPSPPPPPIALQFNGKTDDEKLNQLRKRESARLRGTLTRFWTEGVVTWLDFTDLVIEGKRP
jgi:beta-lactamase regulating signal transducer with metallopeptidase domain